MNLHRITFGTLCSVVMIGSGCYYTKEIPLASLELNDPPRIQRAITHDGRVYEFVRHGMMPPDSILLDGIRMEALRLLSWAPSEGRYTGVTLGGTQVVVNDDSPMIRDSLLVGRVTGDKILTLPISAVSDVGVRSGTMVVPVVWILLSAYLLSLLIFVPW